MNMILPWCWSRGASTVVVKVAFAEISAIPKNIEVKGTNKIIFNLEHVWKWTMAHRGPTVLFLQPGANSNRCSTWLCLASAVLFALASVQVLEVPEIGLSELPSSKQWLVGGVLGRFLAVFGFLGSFWLDVFEGLENVGWCSLEAGKKFWSWKWRCKSSQLVSLKNICFPNKVITLRTWFVARVVGCRHARSCSFGKWAAKKKECKLWFLNIDSFVWCKSSVTFLSSIFGACRVLVKKNPGAVCDQAPEDHPEGQRGTGSLGIGRTANWTSRQSGREIPGASRASGEQSLGLRSGNLGGCKHNEHHRGTKRQCIWARDDLVFGLQVGQHFHQLPRHAESINPESMI